MTLDERTIYLITYNSISEHKRLREWLKKHGYEEPQKLEYSGHYGGKGYLRYYGKSFEGYGSRGYFDQMKEEGTLSGVELPFSKIDYERVPEELFKL